MSSLAEDQLALQSWRDSNRDPHADPDNDLTELTPKLSRLFVWLAKGRTVEQLGLRLVALFFCCRPDLLDGRSLSDMRGNRTRQNLDKLAVEFRETFAYGKSPKQMAKSTAHATTR